MKKWNTLSISVKIFIITALSITAILSACAVGQNFFYEKVYIGSRKTALKDTVDRFISEIEDVEDEEQIRKKITGYSMDSEAYIILFENRRPIWASYEMEIETEDGEKIRIPLDNAVREKSFFNLELKENDTVTVEYLSRQGGGVTALLGLTAGDKKWPEKSSSPDGMPVFERGGKRWRDDDESGEEAPQTVTVSGRITSLLIPSVDYRGTVQRSDAMNAGWEWISEKESESDGEDSYVYTGESKDDIYYVVVENVTPQRTVFAITPLKNVTEAVRIMKRLLIPWFIISVMVALITAVIFSRMVTKPILKISRVTTKMRELDFSEKCDIKQKDELGTLAQNVNDMSDTLDSTIKQLMDANAKLKADIEHERMLEEQRKEFVAAVSHELKTPLAIIRAYAEGLIDGVSDAKREKYMRTIVGETEKMDALVLDMLENAKLEAGREKLIINKYDLVKIALKYKKLFAEAAQQKGISIETELAESARAEFDCDRIEQVAENFMSNALKNTPPGGRIIITAAEREDCVTFSVENEGSHIPEEELPKIWDRFYRVDKSRDRSAGGTGLGLSIAKNILILHKAEYSVQNTGMGVKFGFVLKKHFPGS